MLLLTNTSDLVRVTPATAGSLLVHASWVDNDSGSITPGRTNTAAITGSGSAITVVGSPTGTNKRNVKYLSVRNDHASVTSVVTIDHTDATNVEVLWKGSLLPSEEVVLDANGMWTVYTSGGIPKWSAFVGPFDVQVFTTAGSGTPWTKPTTFTPKMVQVVMWGGGGGGGAGASLASATVAKGGAGGGGGAFATRIFKPLILARLKQ
jgi:hypothetical protein